MRRDTGFTLIELLIVVTIIGIIAAILIPKLLCSIHKSKVIDNYQTMARLINTYNARYVDDMDADIYKGFTDGKYHYYEDSFPYRPSDEYLESLGLRWTDSSLFFRFTSGCNVLIIGMNEDKFNEYFGEGTVINDHGGCLGGMPIGEKIWAYKAPISGADGLRLLSRKEIQEGPNCKLYTDGELEDMQDDCPVSYVRSLLRVCPLGILSMGQGGIDELAFLDPCMFPGIAKEECESEG